MRTAAEQRQYRAEHPEYREQSRIRSLLYSRQLRAENPEYRALERKQNRERMTNYRAFARVARAELRSLLRLGPRTARLIKRHIDIESASDARVARFYRKLKMELKHGQR